MSDTGKCNFDNYIAKTYQVDGKTYAGRSVLEHCIIVGEVCKALLELLPPALKKYFHKDTPFLAALHDIGKVSPTFQKKISNSIDNHPLKDELINVNSDIEKNWGGHAGVGEITLEYIIDEYLQNRREYKYLPLIAGLHHGYKANCENLFATEECVGGEQWNNFRIEHFKEISKHFNGNIIPFNNELISTITIGLVIISDWIASGKPFDDPKCNYVPLVRHAIEDIGFTNNLINKGLSFKDIFGFKPRKSQEELINICNSNGIYILEAPMGIGKTEAALYCAYKMLEKNIARGIYFALPTQLTSNKIYNRFKPFIEKISKNNDCVKLLHSNSKIYLLGSDADIGKSWFDTSKRGLLAPFAVGTIDQALMAVMNVKHYPVRAFGLFGKVVILDEVHSYDTYTGTILDELVKKLNMMGCTVIILSATLTKERKEELIKIKSNFNSYPLITALKNNSLYEKPVNYNDNKDIELEYLDTSASIPIAIDTALNGLQVLWIENTVDKAQDIYKIIKANTNIECGLLHSRFTKGDRQKIEDKWVDAFSHKNQDRYKNGRILIGTQVLEQSIDIDADLLITRHAPMDFLLQRMGRLHRHNIKRKNNIYPKCIIIKNEEDEFSNYVYSPYILERTREVLMSKNNISLPKDIRTLIEDTYKQRSNDSENSELLKLKKELEERKNKLKINANIVLTKAIKAVNDNDALLSTRYSEQDNIKILLIKDFYNNKIMLMDNRTVDLSENLVSNKYEISKIIDQNTLSVSEKYAPKKSTNIITKLRNFIYMDDDFRVALVNDASEIVNLDRQKANDEYNLTYSSNLGYIRSKQNG